MDLRYRLALAAAKTSGGDEDWAAVVAIEEAAMAERCLPEAEADQYLRTRPMCAACVAYGAKDVPASTVTKERTALCRSHLWALTARRKGWPIRGCDPQGNALDPNHPWNREGMH